MTPAPSFGRVVFSVLISAALLATMFAFPLFIIFVPVVLFQCALRTGRVSAWLALTVATLLAGAAAVAASFRPPVGPHDLAINLGILAVFVFTFGVTALLVYPMMQRKLPFSHVLLTMLLLGVVTAIGAEWVVREAAGVSLYAVQHDAVKNAQALLSQNGKGGLFDSPQYNAQWEVLNTYCQAAIGVVDLMFFFTFNLVLFGRVRAWREFIETQQLPVEPPYLFRNFVLPEWMLLVFVGSGLSTLATGVWKQAGVNVLIVVAFLYLLQGLAIFRSRLITAGAGFGLTLLAYAALAVLLVPFGALLLSIAGLFDSFFDYRHFNRKDSTHEGHSD